MSKELEALDRLYRCNDDDYALGYQLHDYNLLKQALIKLEQIEKGKITDIIDNYMTFKNSEQVEPSKAMECLERVSELQYIDHYESREKEIEIIEQALIKAQEQEKVFEIIKEKGVDVGYLKTCKTLEEYNSNCWNDEEDFNKRLTKEEFDLLKR